MMIDVTVADVDLDLVQLYTRMNPLVAGATLTWHSKDRLVFTTASHDQYVITGQDLHWTDGALTGGTIDALSFRSHGTTLISFANLQTTGDLLWAAIRAEQDGRDPVALTHMLVHHCWTYQGSAGVDYFPKTTLAGFGLLNPTGNDKVYLRAGDDTFFTGAAQDTVLGGDGNDVVSGGSDNDALYGNSGQDLLLGGSGDDLLAGGAGNDLLRGCAGADTLLGGLWSDHLVGGAGADVFVFDALSGQDVIRDFTPGLDHLHITSDDAVTLTDGARGCLVQFGAGSVLLLGLRADQVTDSDFLPPDPLPG